jgi:hypothetical protein
VSYVVGGVDGFTHWMATGESFAEVGLDTKALTGDEVTLRTECAEVAVSEARTSADNKTIR